MGLDLEYFEGQTPLDEDEKDQLLISSITTREELDEFEQENIERAVEWTIGKKISREEIIREDFVRTLHRKMFDGVWKWAGDFRKTDKNLGCDWTQIGIRLKELNGNCLYWIENKTYPEDELAVRYKHAIVSIHCFPNGNGRHSRLMADVIINKIFLKPVFTWSNAEIIKKGDGRINYLDALRQADNGNLEPLIKFARS